MMAISAREPVDSERTLAGSGAGWRCGSIDAASVRAYRVLFGALMVIAVVRFFAHGWIHSYFLEPTHFFHYLGFSWVQPWPGIGMYLHFAAMGVLATTFMLGIRPRASIAAFGVLFAYQHLIDKTNYLNHYYLVVCLCVLLAALPLYGRTIPRWALWALRAQVAVVYVFGGIAKLNADWLLDAQPMRTWLAANADFPLIGGLFDHGRVAHVFSIAGCLFDLSIVPLLLARRTRPYAYVAVVAFHLMTMRLFQLGMFPWIMMASSLLFLPPDWPRRLLSRPALAIGREAGAMRPPRWLYGWFALQLLVPLRHLAYPGTTTWTEEGYRFAWNVMRMEKTGSVDAIVIEPSTGRRWVVPPGDYYTRYQTKMMSTQPDMILEFAHVVAADFRARGVREPAVYIDAMAAMNGRRRARLIDPTVDLARESDSLLPRSWILR